MYGASQARVKGMDGANDLHRLLDICHWGADQRLLSNDELSLFMRGEPIQVVGTTMLIFSIAPS